MARTTQAVALLLLVGCAAFVNAADYEAETHEKVTCVISLQPPSFFVALRALKVHVSFDQHCLHMQYSPAHALDGWALKARYHAHGKRH